MTSPAVAVAPAAPPSSSGQSTDAPPAQQAQAQTQDVRIRPATPADAARIAQIYAPYVLGTCITFELDPPDAHEMRRRIEDASSTHAFLVAERVRVRGSNFSSSVSTGSDNQTESGAHGDGDDDAEADGDLGGPSTAIIGYAYASAFHPRVAYRFSCSVSVYLDAALALTPTSGSGHASGAGRKGLGTALLQALLQRLEQRGYRQAFGLIALPNAPSVGLHEKLGFRRSALCERVGWKAGRWVDVGWWQRALGEGLGGERPPAELN